METLRCHSNQSSYLTGIKITNYVEASVRKIIQSTGFIHLTVSEEKIVECYFFFKILPFMGPQQPIKMKD